MLRVKVEGLEDMVRRAGSKTIFLDPVKKAIGQATLIVEREAETRAPRETGRLGGAVTSRIIEGSGGSIQGQVILPNVPAANGFPYGIALDASKTRRYRYASGGRRGKITRRWFSGALRVRRTDVNRLILAATGDIQSRWGR